MNSIIILHFSDNTISSARHNVSRFCFHSPQYTNLAMHIQRNFLFKGYSLFGWKSSHLPIFLSSPLAAFLYSLAALWAIFLCSLMNHIPLQPLPIIILFILLLFISIHCILFIVPYFVQATNIKTSISHNLLIFTIILCVYFRLNNFHSTLYL